MEFTETTDKPAEQTRATSRDLSAAPFDRKIGTAPDRSPASSATDAEQAYKAGLDLLTAGKFTGAINTLRRAIAAAPVDPAAHHALGKAYLAAGRLDEAIASLRTGLMFREASAEAHHDLTVALRAQGRDRDALAAARRAVELAPHSPVILRQLAELLETIGETRDAASIFRRAASNAPGGAPDRLDLVRALILEGDFAGAEQELRTAIAGDPTNDELHKVYGEILAKMGRFDEAIEACDRALRLNALQVPAQLTAVRIRKGTAADRPRLTQMLSTLRNPSATDAHRVFLHFAIAKLLDDLGDYREAMRHFDLANAIRGRGVRFDRAGMAAHIDRLIRRFTADFFASHTQFGVSDETPLLIVGMPRSGTTLVEQIVSSHPHIGAGEELFFWFNRARSQGVAFATSLTPDAGHRVAAEYLDVLRQIDPAAVRVTDKQPFNFQQLGLIHLLLPHARIIHCRRHPIDTCLSMYFTYFKGRAAFISDKGDLAFAYRQYVRLVDHWRAVLPENRFFEIDYETLTATEREGLIRKLIEFCGVGWHDDCLTPERNARAVGTASLWQARQPIFSTSVERWRRYEPWLGGLRELR